MSNIDKTAIIDPKAIIGKDVTIGPYTVIGEDVVIGDGSFIHAQVNIEKWTTIGKNCTIYPFASIGSAPQDLKYKGEKTFVEIGDNTTIRECVTINRSTGTGSKTIVGDNCLLMAYSHIAHDCIVENNVIIANSGTLAGHVTIEEGVIIGGLTAIHQFCVIGKMSLLGGCSKIVKDIAPFTITDGHPAVPKGINLVGLQRKNFSEETISNLKHAFKILFKQGLNTSNALHKIEKEIPLCDEIKHLVNFIKSSKRGISK